MALLGLLLGNGGRPADLAQDYGVDWSEGVDSIRGVKNDIGPLSRTLIDFLGKHPNPPAALVLEREFEGHFRKDPGVTAPRYHLT
jgi:hypothetical protein